MDLPEGSEFRGQFVTNVGLITTRGKKGDNIMTAAWTDIHSYSPWILSVSIGEEKISQKNVIENGEFGISIAADDQNVISSIAGASHGEQVNKISVLKELGYEFFRGKKAKVLLVKGATLNVECKLIKKVKTGDMATLEIQYDAKISEIEEISSRTKEDTNTSILYKERDLESTKSIIKVSKRDLTELENSIKDLSEQFNSKMKMLNEKQKQEEQMNIRFQKLFEERDKLQIDIQENGFGLSEAQNMIRAEEDQINYLRVGQARLDAERESYEIEFTEYAGIELIKASPAVIEERLQKSQTVLIQIGSINLRALEVYEEVKKGYDEVQEKVNTLDKEKLDILSIIEEIDKKKKKEFMKTFNALNDLFSQNFSKLSSKGIAFLEIENTEDIFAGGVNIVVKLAKGKYFDVTSLSGGEQTLVALSLLFAIQEHKPYHFYVFDEIDAALDKRNSERLAGLLHQYMKSGQYIVITHNDAIIMNSNVLYGVSMHDGVSKILSLNLNDDIRPFIEPEKKEEQKHEVSVNAEDTKEVKN